MQRWLMDTVYSSALTECEEGRDGWPAAPLPAQKGKCTIKIRAINILQWRRLMDMKKPSLAAGGEGGGPPARWLSSSLLPPPIAHEVKTHEEPSSICLLRPVTPPTPSTSPPLLHLDLHHLQREAEETC